MTTKYLLTCSEVHLGGLTAIEASREELHICVDHRDARSSCLLEYSDSRGECVLHSCVDGRLLLYVGLETVCNKQTMNIQRRASSMMLRVLSNLNEVDDEKSW